MSEDSVDLDTIISLESRITAALDRIAGAAAVSAVAGQSDEPNPELIAARAKADGLAADLAAAKEAADEQAAEISRLADALEAAQNASTEADELAQMREKTDRLRAERNTIRDERDALAEELDGFRAGGGGASEDPAELLAALRDLRQANEALRTESEAMRQAAVSGDGAPPPDTLNAAMAAELLSLRAERAADAAEMQLIVQELRPIAEGAGDA